MKNFNEITKEVIDRENVDDFDELEYGKIAFIEILTNLDEYPEDFMAKLLHAFIKNADTRIKESLINSFGEFEEFIQILTIMLENIRPETQEYALYLQFVSTIGSELLNEHADITTLYIESIGIGYIVEMAQAYSNKKDALAHILVSFTMNNAYSRLRLVEKLATAFKTDVRNFASLLAHLSVY